MSLFSTILGLIFCALVYSTLYDITTKVLKGNLNKFYFIFIQINLQTLCYIVEPTPVLLAFSLYTNIKKVFALHTRKSEHVIHCINGIRSLSIIWVVIGHTYSNQILGHLSNLSKMTDVCIICSV